MHNQSGLIDKETYKKILKNIPAICVDILVIHKNKFLLGRRVRKPAKGEWSLSGGRVFKNETLKEAAKRKLAEELGIKTKAKDLKFLTVGETTFKDSALGVSSHTVNVIFTLRLKTNPELDFDKEQHSKIVWFSKINNKWHPYVKTTLKIAKF